MSDQPTPAHPILLKRMLHSLRASLPLGDHAPSNKTLHDMKPRERVDTVDYLRN